MGESLAVSRQVKRGVHPIGVAMLHAIRVVRAPQAAPSARMARGELLKIAKIVFRGGERRAECRRWCCPESAPGKNQLCQHLRSTEQRAMRRGNSRKSKEQYRGTFLYCNAYVFGTKWRYNSTSATLEEGKSCRAVYVRKNGNSPLCAVCLGMDTNQQKVEHYTKRD